MTSINTRYNVGVTHGKLRLSAAIKPVNVLSFNPGVEIGISRLKEQELIHEIPPDLLTIFNKYFTI